MRTIEVESANFFYRDASSNRKPCAVLATIQLSSGEKGTSLIG